ncbi:MAG: phage head closure protein [Clostridium sp.]|uniref:phage head closure protein n=1 Tax=Clostridium sp. TaxID=1506 RepID=UPI003073BE49
MQAGELRDKLTFQELIGVQDSFGQTAETWTDICKVWGNINPIAGREFFAAEKINSEITHKIRIRYRKDIKPSMRVVYKGRIFEITSLINEYERNTISLLMCKELI